MSTNRDSNALALLGGTPGAVSTLTGGTPVEIGQNKFVRLYGVATTQIGFGLTAAAATSAVGTTLILAKPETFFTGGKGFIDATSLATVEITVYDPPVDFIDGGKGFGIAPGA